MEPVNVVIRACKRLTMVLGTAPNSEGLEQQLAWHQIYVPCGGRCVPPENRSTASTLNPTNCAAQLSKWPDRQLACALILSCA